MLNPKPKCFCCKSSLNIYRNDNYKDYVYFDKHLYHKKCFVDENKIKKKCYFCTKDIDFENSNQKAVYYDKHFYHTDCFISWCNNVKQVSKKRQFALEHMEMYVEECRKKISNLFEKKRCSLDQIGVYEKETEKHIKQVFTESDFCCFIREEYDIRTVPWKRILDVISGKTDKCNCIIPIEDLYDMWQRKLEMLRKINDKLVKNSDTEIDTDSLIMYDLTVLVRKYNGYLKWKQKQKILESETKKENSNTDTILVRSISNISSGKYSKKDNTDDEIVDIVDDIFG